jgi:hypothetical protein
MRSSKRIQQDNYEQGGIIVESFHVERMISGHLAGLLKEFVSVLEPNKVIPFDQQ